MVQLLFLSLSPQDRRRPFYGQLWGFLCVLCVLCGKKNFTNCLRNLPKTLRRPTNKQRDPRERTEGDTDNLAYTLPSPFSLVSL